MKLVMAFIAIAAALAVPAVRAADVKGMGAACASCHEDTVKAFGTNIHSRLADYGVQGSCETLEQLSRRNPDDTSPCILRMALQVYAAEPEKAESVLAGPGKCPSWAVTRCPSVEAEYDGDQPSRA